MKKNLLFFSVLLLSSLAMAQDRMIAGKVTTKDDGSALPGVNVVLKGTTNGVVTDADGAYKLSIPSNAGTLIFSFIGMVTQEVEIGERTVIDIAMTSDATQLSEVVVTSQGIQKEKKALGYSVATVKADQLTQQPQNDVARILQGKVPGVSITPTGGTSGTATNIQIRGYSSLSGNTQPLFVVDGVPFNSATNNGSTGQTGGVAATTSRFLDLDPNNIENLSVLKGLAATVLYGDQGRNGVILITTKSGRGKSRASEVTFSQSFTMTEIASLPKFQNEWGNGFQGLYGPFFSNWGPEFSEIDSVGHPYQFLGDAALLAASTEFYFDRILYEAAPTIKDFFQKGKVHNTSLNFNGGNDKVGFNGSIGYTNEEGFVPGNTIKRLNIGTGINAALTDKLTFTSSFLYARTDFESPPLNGATGGGATFSGIPSLYGQFLYTPRNFQLTALPSGLPDDSRSIYYRGSNDIANPLWLARNYKETSFTNRFFNASSMAYDFNENFSVMYRVGLDTYTETQERKYNRGGVQGPNIVNGVYQTQTIRSTIWNQDFIVSFSKSLSNDINLTSRAGFNSRNDVFNRDGMYSEGQAVFGLFRHFNFSTPSSRSVAFDGRLINRTNEEQRMGVYADISMDYKDFLFLNLAGRNDWTSTLEKGNNSIFYPSASVSFIPTEAFSSIKSRTLNYLKLRVGFGSSAGFAPFAYGTRTFALGNTRAYVDLTGSPVGSNEVDSFLGNPNLKPELQQEVELGFEAKLIDNRIGVDFAVFNRTTKDLITQAPLDPATGYNSTLVNVGKLENKGIEVALSGTPLRLGQFSWDVILNYTVLRPEVVELGEGLDEVRISGFATRGNFARPGRPYGIILGTAALRDPLTGERVVRQNDGLYNVDPVLREIGNPNPDWTSTLINTFSFMGIGLAFQIDYRHGGDMFASTPSATIGRGVVKEGDYGLDQTFVLPGVRPNGQSDVNGNPIYIPNDIQITASDYGFNTQFNGIDETAIFDATNIRLREVSLSYQLPKDLLSKVKIKAATIQVNGNNLWFNAVNVPKDVNFDPEVLSSGVGNGFGFDYLTGPSAKRYGVSLRLTF